MTARRPRRRLALTAWCAALTATVTTTATATGWAASSAQRTTTPVLTATGLWGVAPTATATSTAFSSPYTFTFPAGSATPQWVTIRRVGAVPLLTNATVTYQLAPTSGNPIVLAELCSTTWTETGTGTCTGGTITTFLSSRSSPQTAAAPALGASYRLRVRESVSQAVTATLSITVPRNQARAAVTKAS